MQVECWMMLFKTYCTVISKVKYETWNKDVWMYRRPKYIRMKFRELNCSSYKENDTEFLLDYLRWMRIIIMWRGWETISKCLKLLRTFMNHDQYKGKKTHYGQHNEKKRSMLQKATGSITRTAKKTKMTAPQFNSTSQCKDLQKTKIMMKMKKPDERSSLKRMAVIEERGPANMTDEKNETRMEILLWPMKERGGEHLGGEERGWDRESGLTWFT